MVGALLLAACGSNGYGGGGGATTTAPATGGSPTASGPQGGSADTIVIKNFAFQPSSLTVAPSATITVRNEDSVAHTVTDKADPKLFNTGDIGPGQTVRFTAPAKGGSYPFICTIHTYMTGTLVVS